MQGLTGPLVTLDRFIVHFTNKLRLFFTTLQGDNKFGWTNECKNAIESIKCYLTEPSIWSSSEVNKELYMYLAISDCVSVQSYFGMS